MITEDFNAYLVAFGESVVWFNGVDNVTISGIYSVRYAEENDGEYTIESRETIMGFREDDVTDMAVGNEIFRGNDVYTVVAKQPDGLGWTEITMERT